MGDNIIMVDEKIFKKNFLEILNNSNPGWIDGDKEPHNTQKADIINHQLKIAIEIKDDSKYRITPNEENTIDLNLMNQRYSDHVKSANNKFRNYPEYKTMVLFRIEYIPIAVKNAIEGLVQIGSFGTRRIGKYSKFAKEEVGGFLLINNLLVDGNYRHYFANYLAKPERILNRKDLEILTGWGIEEI